MPRDDERDNNTPAEDIYKTLYLYLFYLQDSRSRQWILEHFYVNL